MVTVTLTDQQHALVRNALLDAEDKAQLERCACTDEDRVQLLTEVLDGLRGARAALDPMPPDSIERTVDRVRDAYVRLCDATEARRREREL